MLATIKKETQIDTMKLSSPAFQHDGMIPRKYTCEGDNISPPLDIVDVPQGTVSMALIAYDPDVPKELQEKHGAPVEWPHWVVFNLDPSTTTLAKEIEAEYTAIMEVVNLSTKVPVLQGNTHRQGTGTISNFTHSISRLIHKREHHEKK